MSKKEKALEDISIDTPLMKKLFLYNSNHVWDDVVLQINKATGFDLLQCEQIALIAHTKGKALVTSAGYNKIVRINSVLKEIGLHTEII